MPSDWTQRVRQISDNPAARDAVNRIRSRAVTSNPFTSAAPPEPPGTYPLAHGFPTGDHNPAAYPAVVPPPVPVFAPAPAGIAPLQTNTTPRNAPMRPGAVKVAVAALLVAAIATLAIGMMGAYAVIELRSTVDHLLSLDQTGAASLLASGYADDTQVALMVASVAIAAVMTVAYLMVAKAIWSGRRWPRTISPFLVVLSIPAVFIGPLATAIVLAGVIATAAAWMPSARTYTQQRAAFRAAARARR